MRSTPENEAFVDRLINEGRILATNRNAVLAMLHHAMLVGGKILLEDGTRPTPLELHRRVLSNLTPQEAEARLAAYAEVTCREEGIPFREAFIREGSLRPELVREYLGKGSRRAASGTQFENPLECLNRLAEEKEKKENISFAEAFRQVQLDNLALARACIDFYCSS